MSYLQAEMEKEVKYHLPVHQGRESKESLSNAGFLKP